MPCPTASALAARDATRTNREFYDRLYAVRHPALFWLRGRVSFDQQSKTRPNLRLLRPWLRRLRAERGPLDLLDYGCGWGTFLCALPRRDVRGFGFDLSPHALRNLEHVARWRRRRLHRAQVDSQGRPAPDRFDVILCSHVLEHVPSDRVLLDALVRALRPGGVLLVNVPIHEVWQDPNHVRRYDEATLRARMSEAGLRVETSLETDRWTSFLLGRETRGPRRAERLALRALRALLALLPYGLVRASERLWLGGHAPQQLLVLGRR
jgi:2-polyprenyl-3-methyl-5-hydroxy-6-metoxy-1,4-benzoquinol methylase